VNWLATRHTLGIDDGEAFLDGPAERRRAAAEASFRLFDGFLARVEDQARGIKRATRDGQASAA
jgi:hypothetical protein